MSQTEVRIGDHFAPTRVSDRLTAVVLYVDDQTVQFEYRREDGRLNDTHRHELPLAEFFATFRKLSSAPANPPPRESQSGAS